MILPRSPYDTVPAWDYALLLLESKWPEGGPRREPPFREKQGREAAGDPAPTDLLRGLGQFPLTSLNSFSQHKIQGDE